MAEHCGEVPAHRRFSVLEPPFIVEGVLLLDRIQGRGIETEGGRLIQRWVLEFLAERTEGSAVPCSNSGSRDTGGRPLLVGSFRPTALRPEDV